MRKYFIVSLMIVLILAGCTSATSQIITKVTPQKAMELIDTTSNLVFIDVRTYEEYQTGYAEGSVLLPLDTLEASIATIVSTKDTPILIICRSGNRSNQAALLLQKLGYTEIYDVGGILDWPYEIIRP